ncbi:MAG: DNA methyltransferase [Candidatus Bathyarchaeia archaeon]
MNAPEPLSNSYTLTLPRVKSSANRCIAQRGLKQMAPVKAAKPFFKMNSLRIYNTDILETDAIEDESIDLIVTSPPYDIDIKYQNYDDNLPYDQYLDFSQKWLSKIGSVKLSAHGLGC